MTANKRGRLTAIILVLILVALFAVVFWFLSQHPDNQKKDTGGQTSAPISVDAPQTPEGRKYAYAGLPCPTSYSNRLEVIQNIGYAVGYDEKRKDPAWVAFCHHRVSSPQHLPRPTKFTVDERTTSRVASDDYTGTGYDRGHMAPNYAIAICFGQKAQLETFFMSNIVPQRPNLNRKDWRLLEERVVDYARRFGDVWEITGPIFGAQPRRLRAGVEIPDAFYKILLDEDRGKPRVLAFVMSQEVVGSEPLEKFLTSVDETEKESGLDFLSDLPDDVETRLEAERPSGMW
jgi:endonuclease G, mitochondrial